VAQIEQLRRAGLDSAAIATTFAKEERPDVDRLIGYFYRRQMRAALWRKLAHPVGEAGDALTVGFVDLVRFTEITEDIDQDSLGNLIDRFESVVHEMVTARDGRIVKMIGDEVMFVADSADAAVDVALGLVDAFRDDESVPRARAGLATGSVLAYGGDYFGPVVNLAARIAGREDLTQRPLPQLRLKGIGRTQLWAVRRSRRESEVSRPV
jgi:class 3 adenylate cyclase